ncbi:nucleotide sugar dehydrogenase [Chloroflexota bacterium]
MTRKTLKWKADTDNRCCVIGMGYVGLTLSVVLADKGFKVIGIDKDERVVSALNEATPPFFEPGVSELLKKHINKQIFIQDFYPERLPQTIVICVSTPVAPRQNKPMLGNLTDVSREIASHMEESSLVIVRSTVPIGTCRSVLLPLLIERVAKVKIAFCPERTIQGQALKEIQELPQIIGGLNEESVKAASNFFKRVTPLRVPVSSLEAAEMVKLICNCHTDLIYGFGNEVALMAEKFGLDPIELIRSANLEYPRPDLNLPGFVGGGCLSKDPYVLISSFDNFKYIPRLVKGARELNESMPVYMAEKTIERMRALGKDVGKTKVFVAGFSYKGTPVTDDIRGTPAEPFVRFLKNHVNNICGHDFLVASDKIREMGAVPCSLEEGFIDADCVIFLNNHLSYRELDINGLAEKMKKPALIVDCWRLFDAEDLSKVDSLVYGSIGI